MYRDMGRDPRDEDQNAGVLVVRPSHRGVSWEALGDVAESVGFSSVCGYMDWLADNDVTRDEFLARLREHWRDPE